jgi:Zn-finger nucleic acid-binding protein
MKCPKCGHLMEEIKLSGIDADQCRYCRGIYFDHGEFETLLESKMPIYYLKTLFKKLWNGMSRFDTAWRP